MKTINLTQRLLRAAFLLTFLFTSVCPVSSAPQLPQETLRQGIEGTTQSGLEEAVGATQEAPAPFVPWDGAPKTALVRTVPSQVPSPRTEEIARYLQPYIMPLVKDYLKRFFGEDEVPLVKLDEESEALGIPVYLSRSAMNQAGAAKIYMLSAIISLFMDGDRYDLFNRTGKPLPRYLVTQSTGNHGRALALVARILSDLKEQYNLAYEVPEVVVFVGEGIAEEKLQELISLGADVQTGFQDYGEALAATQQFVEQMGDRALYVKHGDEAVIAGNSVAALELARQIEQLGLKDEPVVVLNATAAGGRLAGLTLLRRLAPGVTIVGVETTGVNPVFAGAGAGEPVSITLPGQVDWVDGIAVNAVEKQALRDILAYVDALVLVPDEEVPSWIRWVNEDVERAAVAKDWNENAYWTEGVTGMSVAAAFRYRELLTQLAGGKTPKAILIDETGWNISAPLRAAAMRSDLPEEAAAVFASATAGLEETGPIDVMRQFRDRLKRHGITRILEAPEIRNDPALWAQIARLLSVKDGGKTFRSVVAKARGGEVVQLGWGIGLQLRNSKAKSSQARTASLVVLRASPEKQYELYERFVAGFLLPRIRDLHTPAVRFVPSEGLQYKTLDGRWSFLLEWRHVPEGFRHFLEDRRFTLQLEVPGDDETLKEWIWLMDPRSALQIPTEGGIIHHALPVRLEGPRGPLNLRGFVDGERRDPRTDLIVPSSYTVLAGVSEQKWVLRPGITPLGDDRYEIDLTRFSAEHPARRLLRILYEHQLWQYGFHGGVVLAFLEGGEPKDVDMVTLLPRQKAWGVMSSASAEEYWSRREELARPLAEVLGAAPASFFRALVRQRSISPARYGEWELDMWSDPFDEGTGKPLEEEDAILSSERILLIPHRRDPNKGIILDPYKGIPALAAGRAELAGSQAYGSLQSPERRLSEIFRVVRRMVLARQRFDLEGGGSSDVLYLREMARGLVVPEDPQVTEGMRVRWSDRLDLIYGQTYPRTYETRGGLVAFGVLQYLRGLGIPVDDIHDRVRERIKKAQSGGARYGPAGLWWDEESDAQQILAGYPNPETVSEEERYGVTEPETILERIRRVLRLAQLLTGEAGMGPADQRLVRISVPLSNVGSYAHSTPRDAKFILDLARKRIGNVPFRKDDLIRHYGLRWPADELETRVKQDLAGRPDLSAEEELNRAVMAALAEEGTPVDFGQGHPNIPGNPVRDRIWDEKEAIEFLAFLRSIRLRETEHQVIEAMLRAAGWAGLLQLPEYTDSLPAEVLQKARELFGFLECARVVEASVNLSMGQAFYTDPSGEMRPRDLANLIRSLQEKLERQVLPREVMEPVILHVVSLLDPDHPWHREFMEILSESRRIRHEGQKWSDRDQAILNRARQVRQKEATLSSLFELANTGREEQIPLPGLAGLEEVQEAIAELRRIESLDGPAQPQALVEFFHQRLSTWAAKPEVVRQWESQPPEVMNRFNQAVERIIAQWAGKSDGFIVEHVLQQKKVTMDDADYRPALLAYSLNPTWDRGVTLKVDANGSPYLVVSGETGGFPANITRATAAAGGRTLLVYASGEGDPDLARRVRDNLSQRRVGFTPVPYKGLIRVSLVIGLPTGEEFILVSPGRQMNLTKRENETDVERQEREREQQIRSNANDALELSLQEDVTPNLAIGERLTDGGSELAGMIKLARKMNPNVRIYAASSRGWTLGTWHAVLSAQPDVFLTTDRMLGNYMGVDTRQQDWTPEAIALRAEDVRRRFNPGIIKPGDPAIKEILVSLHNRGEVLVTAGRAWYIKPQGNQTYRTGASDVGNAHFRLAREGDDPRWTSLAAERAVKAEAWVMSQAPENRGLLPSIGDLAAVPKPEVTPLWDRWVPKKSGLEEGETATLERPVKRYEMDVDETAQLLRGRIFHHPEVRVPDLLARANWGTYQISPDLHQAERRIAGALREVEAVAGWDFALLDENVVSENPEDWDDILRSHRLPGLQVSPAVWEKLSDQQLLAAFLAAIPKIIGEDGGLVDGVIDVKVNIDQVTGKRRLSISA